MARTFNGSTQYLANANAIITAEPLTLACWFYTADITNRQALLGIGDESSELMWQLEARGNQTGDPVNAQARGASSNETCYTTTGYSASTWHHACGVYISDTSRAAYIDGGSKGTDTDDIGLVSGVDIAYIGVQRRFSATANPFAGSVAEAAVWNVALTDAEVAILAKGYSPLFVRPENLVAYWPLIRDTDIDRVGGYNMTAYNTPTVAAHPKVIYPVRPHIITAPAAAAEDLNINLIEYGVRGIVFS